MSYSYIKKHLDASKFKLKSPYIMNPEYITIHNTANSASAQNESKYHNNNNNQVSYHIAIDDIEAIEVLPLNRTAWHCGDGRGQGNMKSIGIEICYSKNGGEKYIKAEENAIHLTAKMLHERNWGIDRVKTHKSWSGKYCPHRILDRKNGWEDFLNRVQSELRKLNNTSVKEEKGDVKLLKDATATSLRNEFIADLEKAHANKVFTDKKWIEQAKNGTMTLADAFLLSNKMNKSK